MQAMEVRGERHRERELLHLFRGPKIAEITERLQRRETMSWDNPADAWTDVLGAYKMFANSVNGSWVAPMIKIVQQLAETSYATRLYPHTSHFRLIITKSPNLDRETPYVIIDPHREQENDECVLYTCALNDRSIDNLQKMVTCHADEVPTIFCDLAECLLTDYP